MLFSTYPKLLLSWNKFSLATFIPLLILLVSYTGIKAQIGPGTASVNPPTGGFQIEGNLQANTPVLGVGDWVPGPSGSGGNVLTSGGSPIQSTTTFHLTDSYGSSDNTFAGGKKFNDNPNSWTWVTNSASAKCNINNAMFHFTTAPYTDPVTHLQSVHTWLILAADRESNSGSAYIDFEMLQKTMTDNANGTFTSAGANGGRTVGDILLTLALVNGGGTSEFYVNQWQLVSPGKYDYVDKSSVIPAGAVYGSTNSDSVPVSFGAFGKTIYPPNLFVETAIDLTALLGAIDPCTSLGVKTLFVKTKASPSPTAALVDFISTQQVSLQIGGANAGADQSLCSNVFTVTGSATPSPGDFISSITWSVVPSSGTANIASSNSLSTSVTVTSASVKLAFAVTTNRGCTLKDTVMLTVKPTPTVDVNSPSICNGTSTTLTATTGAQSPTYSWSPGGATTSSINVSPTSTTQYTVTVTDGVSGCSGQGSGTVTVKSIPAAPTVGVVNNCDTTSTLTASNYTGTLLWSTGATTAVITVGTAGTYTVAQTVNGCTSSNGSGVAAPKTTPVAPSVGVVNNCNGTSTLTASNYTGTLTWSTGQTINPISVSASGTYTVHQTVNGCPGPNGSGIAAPKSTPGAPTVGVVNNCDGTSTLTASNYTGSLMWSTGETTAVITVNEAGTYTVTQTINGCTSSNGSGVAAPKSAPDAPSVTYVPASCTETTFSVAIGNVIGGVVYTILDKNGNTIAGVSPSSPYTAPNNDNFSFSNIPAGSGYQVTASSAGCPTGANTCGVTNLNVMLQSKALTTNVEAVTTVTAYPNPFTDVVRFRIESSVSGQASLDLYNIMGQKIKTPFQGNMRKGEVRTIELNLPNYAQANLIYIFRVGNEKVSGKLLKL